jgi:hypothetical protein
MPIDQNFAARCATIFANKKPRRVERSATDVFNLRLEKNSYENESHSTDTKGHRPFGFCFKSSCLSRLDHTDQEFGSKRTQLRLSMRSMGPSMLGLR